MRVRYYGHVGQQSGYGRAALDNCHALLAAGVSLEIRPIVPKGAAGVRIPDDRIRACCKRDDELGQADIVIVHDLPVSVPETADAALGTAKEDCVEAKWIAYTTWEACTAPGGVTTPLNRFDEVWVPSIANRNAFQAIPNCRVLPHAFDETSLERRRAPWAKVEPFRFYFIGAWNSRKNPTGLLRAWAHAFTRSDNVELVLHSPGVTANQVALGIAMTGLSPDEMARITPINRYVTDEFAMHSGTDCFVTAARGEAWNLPAFDAMLAGRRVIATGGLGSDDYLSGTNADLIDSYRVPASVDIRMLESTGDGAFRCERVGAQGLDARSVWLEPDYLDLASAMRAFARARNRDLEVRYDPIERYGYEAVGKRALAYMTELLK